MQTQPRSTASTRWICSRVTRCFSREASLSPGTLHLDGNDGGTAEDPVVLASYGSGNAVIAAGAETAISAYNVGGIAIRNLTLRGGGGTDRTNTGVECQPQRFQ